MMKRPMTLSTSCPIHSWRERRVGRVCPLARCPASTGWMGIRSEWVSVQLVWKHQGTAKKNGDSSIKQEPRGHGRDVFEIDARLCLLDRKLRLLDRELGLLHFEPESRRGYEIAICVVQLGLDVLQQAFVSIEMRYAGNTAGECYDLHGTSDVI